MNMVRQLPTLILFLGLLISDVIVEADPIFVDAQKIDEVIRLGKTCFYYDSLARSHPQKRSTGFITFVEEAWT